MPILRNEDVSVDCHASLNDGQVFLLSVQLWAMVSLVSGCMLRAMEETRTNGTSFGVCQYHTGRSLACMALTCEPILV